MFLDLKSSANGGRFEGLGEVREGLEEEEGGGDPLEFEREFLGFFAFVFERVTFELWVKGCEGLLELEDEIDESDFFGFVARLRGETKELLGESEFEEVGVEGMEEEVGLKISSDLGEMRSTPRTVAWS